MRLPAQVLDCPHPPGCPVRDGVVDLLLADMLPSVVLEDQRSWYRVYEAAGGFSDPNPGYGDSRFAPFDDDAGLRVPTLYLAERLETALLETVLHDVGTAHPRAVSERILHGRLHARITAPQPLRVLDLRDDVLQGHGIGREQVVATPAEHYPCTRRVARAAHATGVEGILWHSRQAELVGRPPVEVLVVFADRVPTGRGHWQLVGSRVASGALLEGRGRELLDELAEALEVVVVRDQELDSGPGSLPGRTVSP